MTGVIPGSLLSRGWAAVILPTRLHDSMDTHLFCVLHNNHPNLQRETKHGLIGENLHREIQTTGPFDQCIEIIDIECVLLSFLSQKFVATKWPIYRGILARSNLLWQGISRGCGPVRGVRLFFSNTVFLKSLKMRLN